MSKFGVPRLAHPSERPDYAHTTPFEQRAYRFDETGWTQMQDLAVPRYGHRFARVIFTVSDTIKSPAYKNPFGLFYQLDKCFFRFLSFKEPDIGVKSIL